MKIFYLRDNIVSVGNAITEDGGKSVIPPKNYRLVEIETGFRYSICAVKKNDHRYTLKGPGTPEVVDASKVLWTKSAAALYKKASGRELNPEALKKTNARQTLQSILPLHTHISLSRSSGDFEKNFKSLIREQGSSANSLMTAKFLVYSMPPGEKSELNKNLLASGIKGPDDLTRLLSKWRSEALVISQKPERSLRRRQTLAAEYER
jgi:hypothetical protein